MTNNTQEIDELVKLPETLTADEAIRLVERINQKVSSTGEVAESTYVLDTISELAIKAKLNRYNIEYSLLNYYRQIGKVPAGSTEGSFLLQINKCESYLEILQSILAESINNKQSAKAAQQPTN